MNFNKIIFILCFSLSTFAISPSWAAPSSPTIEPARETQFTPSFLNWLEIYLKMLQAQDPCYNLPDKIPDDPSPKMLECYAKKAREDGRCEGPAPIHHCRELNRSAWEQGIVSRDVYHYADNNYMCLITYGGELMGVCKPPPLEDNQ